MSGKRHLFRTYGLRTYGEHLLRGLGLAVLSMTAIAACRGTTDPGFDVVAVPSAAYLNWAPPDAGAAPDAVAREASAVASSSAKCEPPPADEFEPSDDVPECPSENGDGWSLDPRATARRRDRDEDVCCYKRGGRRQEE